MLDRQCRRIDPGPTPLYRKGSIDTLPLVVCSSYRFGGYSVCEWQVGNRGAKHSLAFSRVKLMVYAVLAGSMGRCDCDVVGFLVYHSRIVYCLRFPFSWDIRERKDLYNNAHNKQRSRDKFCFVFLKTGVGGKADQVTSRTGNHTQFLLHFPLRHSEIVVG